MTVFACPKPRPALGARRLVTSVVAAALLVTACSSPESMNPAADPEASDPEASGDEGSGEATPGSASDASSPEPSEPILVQNCGVDVAFDATPDRIVALNSGSVEALLALGVDDAIIGALGRPESIQEDLRPAFEALPLIDSGTDSYPSSEVVLELEPELIYSVYPSAFRDTGIATREELAGLGIGSYLAPGRCPDRDPEVPLDFDEIWAEFRELGLLLDAEDAAEALVADQQAAIDAVRGGLPDVGDIEVFWWDVGTDEPTAGACCGAPGMIMRELGVTNAFEDLPDHWAGTSWEQVIDRDPDVVVMVDFGEDDIAEKQAFIDADPTLRELRAFREDAVVVLPFSQTTPGLQNITGIETLGQFLVEREPGA